MTTTPHDALFKATFSQPDKAAELLRCFLDPALCARIDWSSLTLHPGSFVDEQLQAQQAVLETRGAVDLQRLLLRWAAVLRELELEPDGLGAIRKVFTGAIFVAAAQQAPAVACVDRRAGLAADVVSLELWGDRRCEVDAVEAVFAARGCFSPG